MLIKICV